MAALYASSLPPSEMAELVCKTSYWKSNMIMVARFMAGLSQDDIQIGLAFHEMIDEDKVLVESLHWLFEAHDPDLIHVHVQACMASMGYKEWVLELAGTILDPFDCYVTGYYIANGRHPCSLHLEECFMNAECMKMLTVVENGRAFDYIKSIDLNGNDRLGDEGAIVLGEQ